MTGVRPKLICLAALLLIPAGGAQAERLPIRTYTTADGLPSDTVERIVRDSRGFLWIGHPNGLSRFDGQRFTIYGAEDGLPRADIDDLLETREGNYLLATAAGIVRFDPRGTGARFTILAPRDGNAPRVSRLLQDGGGRLWASGGGGLYRIDLDGDHVVFHRVRLIQHQDGPSRVNVIDLCAAGDGSLWIATRQGLLHQQSDGTLIHYTMEHGLPGVDCRVLVLDREGCLWVGTTAGLARLVSDPRVEGPVVAETFQQGSGLPASWIEALFTAGDGTVWVATQGISALPPDRRKGRGIRTYTTAHGLSQNAVTGFAEDPNGNLWMGTESGGLMRLARGGFLSYTEAEGLADPRIGALFEDRHGTLHAEGGGWIYRLRQGRFSATRPNVLDENLGWGWNQWILQDHLGNWWIPTRQGLHRFSGASRAEDLATRPPSAIYTTRDGLTGDIIFRLFEDSRGDIWIGTLSPGTRVQLTRWDRASGTFHAYTAADGVPTHGPTAFCEDGRGGLWIGFYHGDLARHRDGRFRLFGQEHDLPHALVRAMHRDREGRLWAGTGGGGLVRIDDPGAPSPRFTILTSDDGLSSHVIAAITEDGRGRLYLGTDRGIDRLDPATGRIRRFGTAHGLPNAFVNVAHRDRQGVLWFGTLRGIARLVPTDEPPSTPPTVFIEQVRIAGSPHPVSALGEAAVAAAHLGHDRNRIQIGFAGIDYGVGGDLRFQYRLEGADEDWNEPSPARSVDLANLSPGAYRFAVRAVRADGQTSSRPATFSFDILPPLWRRWWFLALLALAAAAAIAAVNRYRMARAVALERVRTRIATDLHDDIGSSLSQIAILSEVLQQRVDRREATLTEPLARIAGVSRELVDSMSDIVWAINPKRDRLGDLVQRMRRFASDAFTAREIAFTFRTPAEEQDLRLGPDLRRQVYLVFKESVHNAVRHSGCTRADIDFRVGREGLVLQVRDDGHGFDPTRESEGHGLDSMQRRARSLHGTLQVASRPGQGTAVTLRVPLGRRWGMGGRTSPPDQVG